MYPCFLTLAMAHLLSALVSLLLVSDSLGAPATEHSTLQKRGIRSAAHRHIPRHALISRDTGAVESIFDGGGWVLPVLIGGQQLYLNLDTGSSDL
jgi:aspergillopepsin I